MRIKPSDSRTDESGGSGQRRAPRPLASVALAGGLLASLSLAHLAARKLTKPAPVETQFLSPWELGIPFDDVSFRTSDGLRLSGWWLTRPDASRTVVVLGGYNSARQHVLGISAGLWRGGANVLLFDNRARGASEGDYVSLGFYELLDAEAAVEYALGREPGLPLGVIGYSMGGAVALTLAASDGRVRAVVVDSPFASQADLLRDRLGDYVGPFGGAAFSVARRFLRHDPDEVAPIRHVGSVSPRPVLFIHGDSDRITDPDDSRRMASLAGESAEVWIVSGAEHVGSYYADREGYCVRVNGFFERHLA